MRAEFKTLDVKLDDTPGALSEGAPSLLPELCMSHTVQVAGTLTDLRLEVSNDGTNWTELAAFTTPGATEYSGSNEYAGKSFRMIRIRTEAFTPAAIAEMDGVGGTFTLVGAETLEIVIDGVPVSVVFVAGDDTDAEVAARIDAACVLAGLPVGTCTVVGGQLHLVSVGVGAAGTISVTSGTASATIGLTNGALETGPLADTPLVTYGGMNTRAD